MKVLRFKKELGFETSPERSSLMSKIKGKDTLPERAMRKALWGMGVRYRLNYKKLPGCPDIVILKRKIVIFIDGEFWHGYNWAVKK
jgi:DNA mismatch endonuclease (patch repair protein)